MLLRNVLDGEYIISYRFVLGIKHDSSEKSRLEVRFNFGGNKDTDRDAIVHDAFNDRSGTS